MLLLIVLVGLAPDALPPIALLVEDDCMSEVEGELGDGSLLETRSAGQVPQDPLKKPHGLPSRHCQWPSEFVQVRMPTQLGSLVGAFEGASEFAGLEA
jgi:hypothetical protein